ncbi:DNA-directed RNA polymerase III subunit RPC7 isoform X3 [Strigops habroptila]|uniref:DNA-directed RNA polymerase III subunit RPC7 isoform X3 n=1 Tax=Strigops habroptila TaxID=2489341 RepID=UPI0011CF4580|nr:DNA-directed RNA polymerase III subunit RPC7 isoform X3 [Strigops habroptila]
MAGSSRGRGRAAFTFNIEAIGFGKGAALPDVMCQPPPAFPGSLDNLEAEKQSYNVAVLYKRTYCLWQDLIKSTDNKPVPLKTGEDEDYMLALKQDLRRTMKKMPYFLAVEEDHEGKIVIERYSKKYQDKEHATWTPDWRRLPREMKPRKKTKRACFCRIVNQILQQQLELVLVVLTGKNFFITQHHTSGAKPKKAKSSEPKSNVDVLKKIEQLVKGNHHLNLLHETYFSRLQVQWLMLDQELEKKDDEEEKSEDEKEKTKDKEGEDNEEAEEPEEYDEEEQEEANDYISSYFEDGDDFGAGSDDNMDEATY